MTKAAVIRFYSLSSKLLKGKILKSVPQIFASYLPFVWQIFASQTRFATFFKTFATHSAKCQSYVAVIRQGIGLLWLCQRRPMHAECWCVESTLWIWFAHQISIWRVIFRGEGKILACHLALTLLWPALFSCQCECINFTRHLVEKIPSNVSLSYICPASPCAQL